MFQRSSQKSCMSVSFCFTAPSEAVVDIRFSFVPLLTLSYSYDCVEAEISYSTYGGVHS